MKKEYFEALGWMLLAIGASGKSNHDTELYYKNCIYRGNESDLRLVFNLHSNWILITVDSKTIFAGEINSKPDFDRLTKQLHINA